MEYIVACPDRELLEALCAFADHLATLPDPRDPRGVRHALPVLLARGANGMAAVAAFTHDHRAWFRLWLPLGQATPSRDTYLRLVLGQRRVDDRSHASTAIPQLLAMLVLDGGIVTLEALGCQKRMAHAIRDRGADYVLALKGNQPQRHEAVVEPFAVEQAEGFEGCEHDCHQTVNKNHGRIETRRCWALGTSEYIRYVDPDGTWPDLRSLVMIEIQRRQGDQVTAETRYYISSLPADARALLQAVRSYWGIENSLHWVLDMAFREDESRIRTGHTTCRSGASRSAGTTGTCSRFCQIRMRLPWHYVDDDHVEGVGHLAYALDTVWGTTPTANDRAVLEILDEYWFGETLLSAEPPPVQFEIPEQTIVDAWGGEKLVPTTWPALS